MDLGTLERADSSFFILQFSLAAFDSGVVGSATNSASKMFDILGASSQRTYGAVRRSIKGSSYSRSHGVE